MKWQTSLLIIFSFTFSVLNAQDSILNRIEGIWINQYDSKELEIWKKENTGWTGKAMAVRGSDSIVWENLKIFYRRDTLFYEAHTLKNPGPVEFHLLASTDDEMVFVNMKHDFPKVIHYKMPDENHLEAEVYGDNYAERLNFLYYRKPSRR